VTAQSRPIGRDEIDLLAWIRPYVALIVVSLLVGLAGGIVASVLAHRPTEAWTYVIQRRAVVSNRDLAPLAEAVFTSSAVYVPAMQTLNDDEPPASFLRRVELRPVPGTPVLIVVGRASSAEEAERVSSATAQALIGTFEDRGFPDFKVLGVGPPIVRSSLSPLVSIMTGGAVGLWAGLAIALAHDRFRRGFARPVSDPTV
jgi:hypothetical protein